MAEQLAEQEQAIAARGANAGKRMAKIMHPTAADVRFLAYHPPELVDVHEVLPANMSRQDVRVAGERLQFIQNRERRGAKRNSLRAAFRVGQAERPMLAVNILPLGGQDLG